MTEPQFDEQQSALLEESKRLLALEREKRDPATREAFTRKVMEAVASESQPAKTPVVPFSTRKSHTFFRLFSAAVLIIALAALIQLIREPSNAERYRQNRLEAEKTNFARAGGTIEHPSWFARYAGKALIAVVYDYEGEHCLWLYPEERWQSYVDNPENTDLRNKKTWRVIASTNGITLPEEPFNDAFGDRIQLVAMAFPSHFEIWETQALQRYLNP
ncbi:MAG: hypothetical protein QNK37_27070 [Acidobacteriota bacterium]|nr:hypothetical protein [Acidobacteriota bacterium]